MRYPDPYSRGLSAASALLLLLALPLRAADPPANSPELDEAARVWLDSEGSAAFGKWLSKQLEADPAHPEWLDMYADILQGSQLGPGDGWFRQAVAKTRHDWPTLRARLDRDGDGKIAPDEFPGSREDFARLDRDHDGAISEPDLAWPEHALAMSPGAMLYYQADADGDGRVSPEEFTLLFERADSGGQGFLSQDDLRALLPMPSMRPPSGASTAQRNDGPSKATLVQGLFRQEIGALKPGPIPGETAPDFTLKTVEGDREFTLSEQLGDKPVVLVFGNITCGPFRSQAGNVQKLHERYKDRAHFLMVYVREAHPTDGWHMQSNLRQGVELAQPATYGERSKVAQTCKRKLGFDMPFLVDTIDDTVGGTYSGMPSRLYVIDSGGKVAYKSGRGPFGFKPAEMEQALIWTLAEEAPTPAEAPADVVGGEGQQAFVPLLEDAAAWARLPRTLRGGQGPLPTWARALADSLPATTASLLELDALHRTGSHLDPILRGQIRWVAARANHCNYAQAQAEADLRRAGVDEADLATLAGDWGDLDPNRREILGFARDMTTDASAVEDDLVARLIATHGEERVVAIVLLLAYSNFQDRLLLSLGVPVEAGGSLAPVDVAFDPDAPTPDAPPRLSPHQDALTSPTAPSGIDDPLWTALNADDLLDRLEAQSLNPGRIRVPTWDEVRARVPALAQRPTPLRIQWSLVGYGYQPELAMAWNKTMQTFGREARQDRVFEETLFWVVTRTIHCFY